MEYILIFFLRKTSSSVRKWKITSIFLKMEEASKTTSIFVEQPKKILQPKTIKNKNNGCGTTPGNLVVIVIILARDFYVGQSTHS
jgi:hypothetical protein